MNVMVSTVAKAENETEVMFDVPKVATSVAALGTVSGVQLIAVFQSPLNGLLSHVALPAKAGPAASNSSRERMKDETLGVADGNERPDGNLRFAPAWRAVCCVVFVFMWLFLLAGMKDAIRRR